LIAKYPERVAIPGIQLGLLFLLNEWLLSELKVSLLKPIRTWVRNSSAYLLLLPDLLSGTRQISLCVCVCVCVCVCSKDGKKGKCIIEVWGEAGGTKGADTCPEQRRLQVCIGNHSGNSEARKEVTCQQKGLQFFSKAAVRKEQSALQENRQGKSVNGTN
jgi:hypothetical protein